MTVHLFRVSGLHCGSCAVRLDTALEDVPGVHQARTSGRTGRTEVTAEDHVDPAVLTAAITAAGFTAVTVGSQ